MISRFGVLAALALWAAPARAQIGLASGATAVALSATKVASVSVSLPGGSLATLPGALVTGTNDFTPIPVATAWEVAGAGAVIPSATVFGRVPTGGPKTFTPFTGGPVTTGPTHAGAAGGTLVLFTQAISDANAVGGRSDNLQVRIDLTGTPELPPGSYTGTLNLLAITQ
jgi:hypothetical protein